MLKLIQIIGLTVLQIYNIKSLKVMRLQAASVFI